MTSVATNLRILNLALIGLNGGVRPANVSLKVTDARAQLFQVLLCALSFLGLGGQRLLVLSQVTLLSTPNTDHTPIVV